MTVVVFWSYNSQNVFLLTMDTHFHNVDQVDFVPKPKQILPTDSHESTVICNGYGKTLANVAVWLIRLPHQRRLI